MQREDDPASAREPLDLMLAAVRRCAQDAGAANALAGVTRVYVPRGRWRYRDPGREIARSIGAPDAVTVLAELGVLQQTLIGDACARIAAGQIAAALVVGGDAGYRIQRARSAGMRASERQQASDADVRPSPAEELLHPAEVRAGIRLPAALYALLESAYRAAEGLSLAAHRAELGALYARFTQCAAGNPHAWKRRALAAEEIVTPDARNVLQAFPYTRRMCADWSVDQAAALLLCSAQHAEALGIAPAQRVHARASSESNHMTPVVARADLHRCPGAQRAGAAALETMGIGIGAIDLVELYSCFPVAVEVYARELGLPLTRELTVTGGMPFAGGPFNNYVLQATCRMAELLRAGAGATGLVSSVSGTLTKQGFGLWSREPGGFAHVDVTAEVEQLTTALPVVDAHDGPARVVACTVVYDKGRAPRALVLAQTAEGARALATSEEPTLVAAIEGRECCGTSVRLRGDTVAFV
jgi:acetyl-CoA C-acetyltransferase